MESIKPHIQPALKNSLILGAGLALTAVINSLLFNLVNLTPVEASIEAELLIFGVLLAIFIVAVGAAVGGAIGSVALPLPPDTPKSRWGKAWRGGLSMGPLFSLIIFVSGLTLSLFAFYDITEVSNFKFSLIFAVVGALFGGTYGLLLGLLLVKNHGVWHVVLAGLIGFAVGGFGLGEGVRQFLLTITHGNPDTGHRIWLVLGYLLFGLVGGAALGFAFSYVSHKKASVHKRKVWHWVVGGVLALLLIIVLRPYLQGLAEMLTPHDADLAFVLDPSVTGTHWSEDTAVPTETNEFSNPHQPDLAANAANQIAQVWSQTEGGTSHVYWLAGEWDVDGRAAQWQTAINVSNAQSEAPAPQVVVDSSGVSHLVWAEAANIYYSTCQQASCSEPVMMSEEAACATAVTEQTAPTLAIDDSDTLLAVWQTDTGQLLSRTWAATETPTAPVVCVPTAQGDTAVTPQLAASGNGRFGLVYAVADAVQIVNYADDQWQTPAPVAANGRLPNLTFNNTQDEPLVAWCSDDGVHIANQSGSETISALPCQSRPELLLNSQGELHLIWYGDQVLDVNGRIEPQNVLYGAVFNNAAWTEPAIINRTGTPTQPSGTAVADSLLLTWESDLDSQPTLAAAHYQPYNCDDYPLEGISKIVYDTARDPEYRPPDAIIPYCQNQYHQLVFMPNPDPAFSDQPATINGGFDKFAALAVTAEYEVLFSTMWYEADKAGDSPGFVLASSVAQLYENLKANPEQYPRGLTVRILLGNPPELAIKEYSGQLFSVASDLRDAGVEKMVDPDIGWRVEIANFDGAMPHSHTKVMIVDGKTILAAGFNMQYEHYPKDHPSGLGEGREDLGMMITGPVSQSSVRMYDDLWVGSDQLTCTDFYPVYRIWQATCRYSTAVADHVPEVLKFYLPDSRSTAFSMYRNEDHDEADRMVQNGLSAAQHQVDAMHVMFAMDMECDLNLLFNLCDFGEATEYLEGLMQAAENGAHIRLILKAQPTDGIESSVAYNVFLEELENRGLRDQVEIRFFEVPIHYKTTLIDDEFLIVGSQNFHYSAFGQGEGLAEYSLGTDDAQAIVDFKRLFDYQWEKAQIPDF